MRVKPLEFGLWFVRPGVRKPSDNKGMAFSFVFQGAITDIFNCPEGELLEAMLLIDLIIYLPSYICVLPT